MTMPRRSLLRRALGVCLIAGAAAVAVPASADRAEAQRLFVEALALNRQASEEQDATRRAELLEKALARLDEIVAKHGETRLATQLGQGKPIGSFDRKEVERMLAEARGKAPGEGARPATTKAEVAPLPIGPVTGAEAGRIVTAIVGTINNAITAQQQLHVTVAEPISAGQSGDTVSINFRGIAASDARGFAMTVGDVRLDVTPQRDGRYGVAMVLPKEVVFLEQGQPVGRVSVRDTAARGTWLESIKGFLDAEGRVGGLKVELLQPQPIALLEVDEMTMIQEGTLVERLLSTKSRFEIGALQGRSPGTPQEVKIRRIGFTSEAAGINVEALRKVMDALQAPVEKRDAETMNRIALAAMLDFLSPGNWARVGGSWTIEGVEVAEDGAAAFSLGKAESGFQLDDKGTAAFTLGVERLEASTASLPMDLPPDMLPHSFTLDASLVRLPLPALAASARAWMDKGDVADPAVEQAMTAEAMRLVFDAKPGVEVRQARLISKLAEMALSGTMILDQQSPSMTSGAFDLAIAGLDEVKSYLDKAGQSQPALAGMTPFLVALRGLGNEGVLGSARAKTYRIKAAPDGMITINDTPWQSLLPQTAAK